ncbi:hypothetical protein BASA83_012636 [Batrachochytrium salamandrivorans]|nr:hypothetical protein BASA83_012636 [Batrachochytrium salamandrivorans]
MRSTDSDRSVRATPKKARDASPPPQDDLWVVVKNLSQQVAAQQAEMDALRNTIALQQKATANLEKILSNMASQAASTSEATQTALAAYSSQTGSQTCCSRSCSPLIMTTLRYHQRVQPPNARLTLDFADAVKRRPTHQQLVERQPEFRKAGAAAWLALKRETSVPAHSAPKVELSSGLRLIYASGFPYAKPGDLRKAMQGARIRTSAVRDIRWISRQVVQLLVDADYVSAFTRIITSLDATIVKSFQSLDSSSEAADKDKLAAISSFAAKTVTTIQRSPDVKARNFFRSLLASIGGKTLEAATAEATKIRVQTPGFDISTLEIVPKESLPVKKATDKEPAAPAPSRITYLRSILAPILGHQMEHVSKIDRRTTKHGARFRITVPEDRQRNIIQRLERQSKQTHWRIRQNYRHRRPDQPRPTAPPPPLSRQILAVNVANISNKRPAIRHIHPATGPGRRGIALGIPSCFGGHEHGSAVGTMILAKVPNFTPECLWIVGSVYVGHSGATTNYSRREAFASIRQSLDRVVPFDNNHPVLIFGDWNTDPQRLQRIVHSWGHGLTVMQFSGSQITRLSTVHGRRHSSIDHFVCNAPARALLTSPRVDRQTAVADHFVIRTSIRAEAQGQPPAPRAPTISRHHCLEATDRIATSNYWDVLADATRSNRRLLSGTTKRAILASNTARQAFIAAATHTNPDPVQCNTLRDEWSRLKATATQLERVDGRKQWVKHADNLDRAVSDGRTDLVFAAARAMSGNSSRSAAVTPLYNSDGIVQYDPNIDPACHARNSDILDQDFSWNQIAAALLQMSPRKAPGDDDGDPLNPGDKRGIALINVGLKLVCKVLQMRIERFVETNNLLSYEQAGFRKREECVGQVVSLVDIIQRRQNAGLNTHVLFIDIRKAFDTVPVGALLWKLQNMGFPRRTLAFLKALYTSSSARARAGSLLSDPFPVQRGVRQGCPLSGLLFNLFINDILDGVAPITVPGLPRDTNPIRGLMYADDVAVFADSEQSLLAASTAIEQWANQLVSRVESYKYLGVLIDSKLDHSAWLKQKRSALEHTISALHPVLANPPANVTPCTTADDNQQGYPTVHWLPDSRLPLDPFWLKLGLGHLLTRSLVSRVRLLERSVTKRTPINAICSGTDNDVFTLNVQGQLVRSQRWFWSRRTKQLYRNRYWLTPQVRPKTVKQRHSFALMETLRTCGDSASLQKYVTRQLLDTSGFFKDPSFDQSRAHGTRYLMLARMDALWTARKAIQIGILVDTHPFSVDHCILCDQQLLSTSIAHLVVECEQVTGHRIQSGLVPAIQKSRLRLAGSRTRSGCGECIYLAPRWSLKWRSRSGPALVGRDCGA